MSVEVVKTILKKGSSSFDDGCPIGTEGKYVDMYSQLDLEEEIKIGGNKCTVVQTKVITGTNTSYTKISEFYATENIELSCTGPPGPRAA